MHATTYSAQFRGGFGEPSPVQPLVPPAGSYTLGDAPLASNAQGPPVAALQSLLATWGFSPGTIDGVLGPRTTSAITAAWDSLQRSASDTVRANVAGSWTVYPSVGQLTQALGSALQMDAMLTGRRAVGAAPAPASPPATVSMSSAEALEVERSLGLAKKAGVPWWGWGLLGVGAVALVAAFAGKKRR